MGSDPRLEQYLSTLERVLKPLPVSDRAEIVTEIKSHVMSALERDPQARLESVLDALGSPETVANRYLLERGLKPTRPPISPIVKWMVIGFLGTFGMILLFLSIIALRFSPLLTIDEENEKVSILGGLIQFDGKNGSAIVGDFFHNGEKTEAFEGNVRLTAGQKISFSFGNGKVTVRKAEDQEFTWRCRTRGAREIPQHRVDSSGVILDAASLAWIDCELFVPSKSEFVVHGTNGKIDFEQPEFHVTANLANGKVDVMPRKEQLYRYQLHVTNGYIDTFTSSDATDAYRIAIQLGNGKITRRD